MRAVRGLLGGALLALVIGGPALAQTSAPNPADLNARIAELEGQVLRLIGRVSALEARTAGPTTGDAPLADDGLVWTFDAFADGSPFAVTHKALDRAAGQVDLLLRIVAPLDQPAAWGESGAAVPLTLTSRGADGTTARVAFVLVRGARTDVGAHLHLRASLDPAAAAAARQMVISRADGG